MKNKISRLSKPVTVTLILAASFLLTWPSAAADTPPYRFEEGEPLAYKMEITATNEVSSVAKFYSGSYDQKHSGGAYLTINYQWMPISRNEKGEWKLSLVLDRVLRVATKDGESKEDTYSRTILPNGQKNLIELLNAPLTSVAAARAQQDNAGTTNAGPSTVVAAEEKYDDPILAWFDPTGNILKIDDQSELQHLMPGIRLKECLTLAFPTLAASNFEPQTVWSADTVEDWPEPPMAREQAQPMTMKLNFRVRAREKINGRNTASIVVTGQFSRDKLSVPIGQHEMNYLMWTTFLTKIDDRIEGEFLYDIDRGLLLSSDLTTTYRYNSFAGRKADNYRGRINSEHVIRTHLTNKVVENVPAQAQAAAR